MFRNRMASAVGALAALALAVSAAPAQAHPAAHLTFLPEIGDQTLALAATTFSGDAYDNEMGYVAPLLPLVEQENLTAPLGSTKGSAVEPDGVAPRAAAGAAAGHIVAADFRYSERCGEDPAVCADAAPLMHGDFASRR